MTMSYLWVGMLALALFCGLLNGTEDLGRAALAGAGGKGKNNEY